MALRVAEAERNQILGNAINNYQQPFIQQKSIGSIIVLILILVLIFAALVVGKKMGVYGAEAAMKLSKFGASYAGRRAPGFFKGAAGLRNKGLGLTGRALNALTGGRAGAGLNAAANLLRGGRLEKAAGAFGNSRFGRYAKNIGARTGLTSALTRGDIGGMIKNATVLPQAILARMKRLSDSHYDPATAYAQDMVNAISGENTNFGDRKMKELAAKKEREMDAKTSPEQVKNLLNAKSFSDAFASFMALAKDNNLNDALSSSQFFDSHRPELIQAAQNEHIFTPQGDENFKAFMADQSDVADLQGRLADADTAQATRDEINKRWAADATHGGTFKDSFAVSETSEPVFTPTLAKHAIANEFKKKGATEDQAVMALSQISEVMGNGGLVTSYGMTTYDPKQHKLRRTTKEEQAGVIDDKLRKMGSRRLMETMHSNALGTEKDGVFQGFNEFAPNVLNNIPGSTIKDWGNFSRADMRDVFMAQVKVGGKDVALHEIAKQGTIDELDAEDPSSELGALLSQVKRLEGVAKAPPKGTNLQKVQRDLAALRKKRDNYYKRMVDRLAGAMAAEFLQSKKMTGIDGKEITFSGKLEDIQKAAADHLEDQLKDTKHATLRARLVAEKIIKP